MPAGRIEADVAVAAGRIASIGEAPAAAEEIDARGLWVLPGGVDAHVHSRDPGFPLKEDFGSLTAAAAAGGITTVVDMPNTVPGVDSAAVLEEKVEVASAKALVDFGLWGLLRSSSTADEVSRLLDGGTVGLKAFLGYPVHRATGQVVYSLDPEDPDLEPPPDYGTVAMISHELVRRDLPLAAHCEDPGVLRAYSRPLVTYADLLEARPPLAETLAIEALAAVSRATRLQVQIVHLSSASGLEAARQAQASGARLVLETCPQYLWLTGADYDRLGGVLKMYPPVRTEADRQALREGLLSGAIARIGTDHAPHTDAEKLNLPLEQAAAGSPGVETLYLSCLELARQLGEPALAVRWVCEGPARALRLDGRKGAIRPGADADLVLMDPAGETVFRADRMHSRQRHGALEGVRAGYAIRAVWSRGELVAREGEPVAGIGGRGRLVRPA